MPRRLISVLNKELINIFAIVQLHISRVINREIQILFVQKYVS